MVLKSSRRSFFWVIPEITLNTSAGNLQTFTVAKTGCVEDEVLVLVWVLGCVVGTFSKVSKIFFFASSMCRSRTQLVELAVDVMSDNVNLMMCKL